jgi:hypothetical protein
MTSQPRQILLAPCLLVAALLAVPGCTIYTKLPDPPAIVEADAKTMPQLVETLEANDKQRKSFESKRDTLARTQDGFNKAVFLLAGGAAGALIFDAPRLVALGLGAGAGAVYSYGALFHPTSRAALYNAGAQALACVYDKGAPALTAASTVRAQEELAEPAVRMCQDQPGDCQIALQGYHTARGEARALFADDGAAAEAVRQATAKVIMEVNRQAEAAIPDIGQVFAAASGIANIAKGFLPPEVEDKAAPSDAKGLTDDRAMTRDEAIQTLNTSTAAINRAVSLARERLNSLSTPCAVSVAAEAPLTIDEASTKITFTKPETREFSVSGGTQPLTVRWNGAAPAEDVLDFAYLPPRTIRLVAKKPQGGPYNLLISDRNSAVNVEITMTPANGG